MGIVSSQISGSLIDQLVQQWDPPHSHHLGEIPALEAQNLPLQTQHLRWVLLLR